METFPLKTFSEALQSAVRKVKVWSLVDTYDKYMQHDYRNLNRELVESLYMEIFNTFAAADYRNQLLNEPDHMPGWMYEYWLNAQMEYRMKHIEQERSEVNAQQSAVLSHFDEVRSSFNSLDVHQQFDVLRIVDSNLKTNVFESKRSLFLQLQGGAEEYSRMANRVGKFTDSELSVRKAVKANMRKSNMQSFLKGKYTSKAPSRKLV